MLEIRKYQGLYLIAVILPIVICGCGGGGGGSAPTTQDGRLTGTIPGARSVNLHNYNNWEFPNGSSSSMDTMLTVLARRDNICFSESYEHANSLPGWRKISVQSVKALNPSARVYRLYNITCKPSWDTDVSNPSDLRRLQCPLTKADIDANNWWLRDGNGSIAKESNDQWFLDVGKPGFKEAFLNALLTRNAGKGFDGFVFDYVPMRLAGDGPGWGPFETYFTTHPLPAAYASDADYLNKAVRPFVEYVWNGLHTAGYRVIGNCIGELGTPYACEQYLRSKCDGAIYEVGTTTENGGWEKSSVLIARMQSIRNDPLEVWVGDGLLRDSVSNYSQRQVMSLAYYYIAIPPTQQHRCYDNAYDWTPHWQTAWDLNIGDPAGEAVKKDGLYFWSRSFTKGLVLFNYEQSTDVTYTLDRQYVDVSGKVWSGAIAVHPRQAMILATR